MRRNQPEEARPPTTTDLSLAKRYLDQIFGALPPAYRPIAAGLAGLIIVLLSVVLAVPPVNDTFVDEPQPSYDLGDCYLATALLAPDENGIVRDVNLVVRNGVAQEIPLQLDISGHAVMPTTDQCAPGNEIPNNAQVAPIMGWNVTFMSEVFSGQRPLRYCNSEREAYDRQFNKSTAAIGERAIRAVFDIPFEIKNSVKDCSRADLVLGANAESNCGNASAWGCAALGYANHGPFVRVTFNGNLHNNGTMRADCIEFAIDWHELKHAGDLGHTGQYGGEGRGHSHKSDMGYANGNNCRPIDNPSGPPAIEDWQLADGHTFRYNAKLRNTNPSPSPIPSPSIAPSPSASPTPPPAVVNYFAWVQLPGQTGYRLVSQGDILVQASGTTFIVIAENGQWRGQININRTGTEPLIAPNVFPVQPVVSPQP